MGIKPQIISRLISLNPGARENPAPGKRVKRDQTLRGQARRGSPMNVSSVASSRTAVYGPSLMLLVEISNTHVSELSRQLVPFVTMK